MSRSDGTNKWKDVDTNIESVRFGVLGDSIVVRNFADCIGLNTEDIRDGLWDLFFDGVLDPEGSKKLHHVCPQTDNDSKKTKKTKWSNSRKIQEDKIMNNIYLQMCKRLAFAESGANFTKKLGVFNVWTTLLEDGKNHYPRKRLLNNRGRPMFMLFLGASRCLNIRKKDQMKFLEPEWAFELDDGDLVILGNSTAGQYGVEIPKNKQILQSSYMIIFD